MIPDPSSQTIQRYSAAIFRSAGYMGLVVEHDVADDGPWVKWSDVEARLAQLAQEQAIKDAIHKQELENCGAAWEDERARRNTAEDALDLQAAALGETRQALQQLQQEHDELLARVDTTGSADALVPQPPTGDKSTPSPVKEQECQ